MSMIMDFDPKRSILLVMDYQEGIAKRMPDSELIIEKMAKLINAARKSHLNVGYVRVAFTNDDYANVSPNNISFSTLAETHSLNAEDSDTQIVKKLAPINNDIIVRKTRVGAFSTTDLEEQLKKKKIDTLLLAGFSTSGVVLSTLRDAADRDYRLFVLEDACSDPDPSVHDLLMHKIFPRQAQIIQIPELLDILSQ